MVERKSGKQGKKWSFHGEFQHLAKFVKSTAMRKFQGCLEIQPDLEQKSKTGQQSEPTWS